MVTEIAPFIFERKDCNSTALHRRGRASRARSGLVVPAPRAAAGREHNRQNHGGCTAAPGTGSPRDHVQRSSHFHLGVRDVTPSSFGAGRDLTQRRAFGLAMRWPTLPMRRPASAVIRKSSGVDRSMSAPFELRGEAAPQLDGSGGVSAAGGPRGTSHDGKQNGPPICPQKRAPEDPSDGRPPASWARRTPPLRRVHSSSLTAAK